MLQCISLAIEDFYYVIRSVSVKTGQLGGFFGLVRHAGRGSRRRSCMSFMGAVAAVALMSGNAFSDQLEDIKARGTLICGTLGTAEPFSFQDPKTREIIGFDVDACKAVAADLGVKLQVQMVAVDARIPSLMQGRVDILAANLGYTKARAEQIDYSHSYFVSMQKLLVRADSGIDSRGQLKGKRIAATKGSTSEMAVRREIPEAQTTTYNDGTAAYLAVVQNKVSAFCSSELNLVKLKDQSEKTQPLKILDDVLMVEAWGLGVRKGEKNFLDQVNKTLARLETTGEIDVTFKKWFGNDTIYKMKREYQIAEIKD